MRSTKIRRIKTEGQRCRRWPILVVALFLIVLSFACAGRPSYHVDTPRSGERRISNKAFIECIDSLLRKAQESTAARNEIIPLLVVPVTLDYVDMKTFFCNLTVAVERIMLIHSGVYGPITEALRELVSTISAPDHLFVRHHPENLGYAASVNMGFRIALDLGFERVPFVFVSNSDVRYFGSLLRELVIIAHYRTRHDGVALAALRAEVLYESGKTSHSRVDVWKGHYDTGTVVTSRLLPERIRRMTSENMNSTFRRHHGMFFPHHGFDMSSFFVSHLALSVAGLLDENYFPAYGEDYDFIFRLNNLGFRFHSSLEGRFRHFVNANLFPAPLHHPSPLLWRKEARLQLARFSRMNYEYMRLEYRKQKWYYHTNIFNEVRGKRGEYPFAGRMPVDAWVRDEARIESIRLIGEGKLCRKNYLPYNTSLIEAVQP